MTTFKIYKYLLYTYGLKSYWIPNTYFVQAVRLSDQRPRLPLHPAMIRRRAGRRAASQDAILLQKPSQGET